MSDKLKIIKGTVLLYLKQIVSIVFAFVISLFLANYLGPTDYGLLNFSMNWISSLIGVFGIFSLNNIISRYVAETKSKNIFKKCLTYQFILEIILALFVFFGSDWLAIVVNKPISRLLKLLAFIVFLKPLYEAFYALFYALKDFMRNLLMVSFKLVSYFILVVFCIYALNGGVISIVVSSILSFIIVAIYSLFSYRKIRKKLTGKDVNIKRVLKFISFSFPSSIVRRITETIYVSLIGIFLASHELGYFGIADKIASTIILIVSSAVSTVFYPFFSEVYKDKKKLERYLGFSVKTSLISSTILFALICFLGKPVLGILYPKYIPSFTPMIILSFGYIFAAIGLSLINVLLSMEKVQYVLLNGIIFMLSIILFSNIFIPSSPLNGAAITKAGATVVSTLSLIFIVKKHKLKISFMPTKGDIKDYINALRLVLKRIKRAIKS